MAEYQVVTAADKRQLSDFLIREGQFLIPMVKLIEQSELAIEHVIDVTGRACVEAVLEMSASQVAGDKSPGKASGEIRWHGRQDGLAYLGERKLRVGRPRLRHKTDGEMPVPAYEAMKTGGKLAQRMMSILLDGVSTRKYKRVIPEMAQTVGVSKSAVSRANIEAGEKLLAELAERRLDDKEPTNEVRPMCPNNPHKEMPLNDLPARLEAGRHQHHRAGTGIVSQLLR
jgi:putative transposase